LLLRKQVEAVRYSPPYSRYAEIYDLIGQRHFGQRIASETLEWLRSRGIAPRTAVDLACGTGAATLEIAQSGIRSIGVDSAPQMLDRARKVASKSQLPVRFTLGDMRSYRPKYPVDLITCFYDSVNYLTGDGDLDRFLGAAINGLRPNGHLVFDINTRKRLQHCWEPGFTLAADREDVFAVYRSWYDEERAMSPLIVTGFIRGGIDGNERTWTRFDEEHIERAYYLTEVGSQLEQAGFRVVDLRAFLDSQGRLGGTGSEECQRVVFFAESTG
jgi:SAM-dependent methyltransferase